MPRTSVDVAAMRQSVASGQVRDVNPVTDAGGLATAHVSEPTPPSAPERTASVDPAVPMAAQTLDDGQASPDSWEIGFPPASGSASWVRVWFWLAGGAGGVKVGLPVTTTAPVVPLEVPTPLITHWAVEGHDTCESEDMDPVGAVSAAGKLSIDHELPPALIDPVRTSGPTVPPGPTTPADVDPVLPVPMAMQAVEDAQATWEREFSVRYSVPTGPPTSVAVP